MFTQEELDAFAENTFKTMPIARRSWCAGWPRQAGFQAEVILAGDMVMEQILARKKFGGTLLPVFGGSLGQIYR
jgi:hypothetical protein